MTGYKTILAYMLTILFLSACGTLPIDTLNKRIAAFEITYGETLKTIQLWIDEGRIKGAEKALIQADIKAISQARQAMYIAKGAGDITTAQSKLNAANAAVRLIRDYLVQQEKAKPTSYYMPLQLNRGIG